MNKASKVNKKHNNLKGGGENMKLWLTFKDITLYIQDVGYIVVSNKGIQLYSRIEETPNMFS